MSADRFFISAWDGSPWIFAVCVGAILAYLIFLKTRRKTGWLLAGLTILFITLASPLAALADGYLFSAHMLQHLLLLLVVPPLLLLSLPLTRIPRWRWLNWTLGNPPVTWFLGLGGMWIWHARTLCNAAVTHGWVHGLQTVSLLAMGLAFWWPIVGPLLGQRLSAPAGVVYLFSACVGCTVLGIIITFSPVEVCSIYLHPADRLGILSLLQNQWGLTPSKDQQLGGLLMWVPACLIYLGGIIGLLARWYGETNEELEPFIGEPHAR